MPAKVRIGFIGVGGVAQNRHLPALAKIPEAELGPVWTRTPAKAQDAVEQYGFSSASATWQEVAESPDVDAVIESVWLVSMIPNSGPEPLAEKVALAAIAEPEDPKRHM